MDLRIPVVGRSCQERRVRNRKVGLFIELSEML